MTMIALMILCAWACSAPQTTSPEETTAALVSEGAQVTVTLRNTGPSPVYYSVFSQPWLAFEQDGKAFSVDMGCSCTCADAAKEACAMCDEEKLASVLEPSKAARYRWNGDILRYDREAGCSRVSKARGEGFVAKVCWGSKVTTGPEGYQTITDLQCVTRPFKLGIASISVDTASSP